ncbi:MAG: hypoxanthine phosphoribosyltransferase [Clostridia bacterium]|nr:hypoxanthine phosphoribosyltransferase [Clostridia bacterium]
MLKDIQKVFFSKEELEAIARRLGSQISRDYENRNLLIVSVLKGSVIFMADLMRNITIPCKIDFITASSYHAGTESSGNVSVTDDLSVKDVHGYDILIVEDILDTGRTLQKLSDIFARKGANSVTICTLLDKPERRDKSVKIKPTYIGATVENEFVVGYGLDYDQKYRNLPFIGILKPEVYDNTNAQEETHQ